MKFSLLTLLGVVALAAVGCVALATPVPGSAMVVVTAVVLLLFGSVLAAIYCGDAARAFWLGWAILGWGYLLLIWICFEREVQVGEQRVLATTWVLDALARATIPSDPVDVNDPFGNDSPTDPGFEGWTCLLRIGHSLWAILFALAGGLLARGLYARRERLRQ